MFKPLYDEKDKLTNELPSPSRQASLERLSKIDQGIRAAWLASEEEEEDATEG
jgi:hypothetical protein